MEDCVSEVKSRKRVRDDSGSDSYSYSAESKRIRDDPEVDSSECKRVDSDLPESNFPDVNKIRDDILHILDDSDAVTDRGPVIEDLDSVIKSFEEEIHHPVPAPAPDSGELGYLLEASDDELGLPPAISTDNKKLEEQFTDLAKIPSDAFGFGENIGFENEMPSYGSFGFGFCEETEGNGDGGDGDFVIVGGLFDYSETSDFAEFSWRPESLPAQ